MAILINDTSPRSQYTATASQTVFSVPFEFFSNADLLVYQNSTLKTLTTHYTVTGAGVTGGGSITLVTGATAGDVITIVRDIPVKRVTDFPTSGPFNIDALNTDLDRLTAMVQERENQVSRVISLAQTDAAVNLYLPTAATRASKVMGFDSNGNVIIAQELGQYRGNWASGTAYVLRDIIKDTSNANIYICVTAHTSTGSQPISSNANSASWALLVDAATATTASASASSSASAAASSASSASSSASSATSSASSATSSASTATTQASNASTSATNAASSASSASTSATNAGNSATAASNSAALAAATVAGGLYSAVIDKSANYTVVLADAGDLLRVTTTAGAVTITLPQISTVTDGFKVAIVKWTADSNAVTISRSGSDTINGATSASIGSQYTQITFVADFETNQWFAAASGLGSTNVVIDTFNGTGAQVAFTLSGSPGTINNTYVYVSGVYQAKATYTLSTTTLTFSTAPPSGTGNVEVVWTQPLPVGTPSDGTVTTAKIVDANVTAAKLAADSVTTAKILNSNVTIAKLSATGTPSASNFLRGDNTWATPVGVASDRQVFNASGTWTKPASGTYVVIQIWGCGGGAGQSGNSIGAGGGGGYSSTTCLLSDLASTVSVTIGAGGAGATGAAAGGTGGSITFGSYLTHVGGIGGFRYTIGCTTVMVDGGSGRLSASSGLTLIAGSVELSGWYSYQTSSSVYPKHQYYAPCQGGSSSSQVGTSVFGGNGGAVGGATGGAGSAPGGGGGQGTTTGGAGAIGRMIVTVY